jgi:hypothetical protein
MAIQLAIGYCMERIAITGSTDTFATSTTLAVTVISAKFSRRRKLLSVTFILELIRPLNN